MDRQLAVRWLLIGGGAPSFSRTSAMVKIEIKMPLSGSHPQREALERAALNCPVAKSLSPEIQIPVSFSWRDDL